MSQLHASTLRNSDLKNVHVHIYIHRKPPADGVRGRYKMEVEDGAEPSVLVAD